MSDSSWADPPGLDKTLRDRTARPNLTVPFALDPDGSEVRPDSALPHVRYFCPDCHTDVFLRRPAEKRQHLYHHRLPSLCDFLHETEEHFRTKMRIVELISTGQPVVIQRHCPVCRTPHSQPVPTGLIPSVEYTLSSGHRADVALLDSAGTVRAVIEVRVTHPVDDEKATALAATPWIEVVPDSISDLGPWAPVQDHFRPFRCGACEETRRQAQQAAAKKARLAVECRLYGRVRPIEGRHHNEVACPLVNGQPVSLVEVCGRCAHFVEFRKPAAIFCLGLRALRKRTHAGPR